MCEAFLVALFDRSPIATKFLVVDMIEETFELRQVFEPDTLVEFQGR